MYIVFFLLVIVHGAIHSLHFLKNLENTTQKELTDKIRKSKWSWGITGTLLLCYNAQLESYGVDRF